MGRKVLRFELKKIQFTPRNKDWKFEEYYKEYTEEFGKGGMR